MYKIGKYWNHFWFEPVTPDNLGFCRMFLCGSMLLFYLLTPTLFPTWGWHVYYYQWGAVSHVFWQPIQIFRLFHLPQFSPGVLIGMDLILKVSLFLGMIGLFTRTAMFTAFVVGFYLFGLQNNFGKTHHLETELMWFFLIMTFAKCGDAFSIDKLWKTARKELGPTVEKPVKSGEYTWPIKLFWCLMALIYCEAGISKMRHAGPAWFTSNLMQFFIQRAQYHVTDAEPLTKGLALYIARHPLLLHATAVQAICVELFYPIALFSKRARWVVPLLGIAMQTGIAMTMGPNFWQLIICQLLWYPLADIFYWSLGKSPAKIYAVIYDGGCGICKKTVGVLKSLDIRGEVEFFDAVNEWPEIEKRFPKLNRDACLEDMHGIDRHGKIRPGFEAYRGLTWVLPLGWILIPVFYFPGASFFGKKIYRYVADHRHDNGCALPPQINEAKAPA